MVKLNNVLMTHMRQNGVLSHTYNNSVSKFENSVVKETDKVQGQGLTCTELMY